MRSTLKIFFLKLYPEANKFNKQFIGNKKLAKFDLAQEQTDDLFTSGDSASSDDAQPKKLIRGKKIDNKSLPERILVFIFKALIQ